MRKLIKGLTPSLFLSSLSACAGDLDKSEGVLGNDKAAVYWFTKFAEQGQADAQYGLGVIYAFGQSFLENNKIAYMWFNLASYNGSERAMEAKNNS